MARVVVAALLGVLAAACSGAIGPPAATPTQPGDDTRGEPTLTASDHRTIGRIALEVLVTVADAREEVHQSRPDDASAQLESALHLADNIDALLPTATLRGRLRIAEAHLAVESPADVLPDLVPVSGELARLAGEVPTTEADEHLDDARAALEHGDAKSAAHELAAVDASVVYPEVEVSLDQVRRDLRVALDRLNEGRFGAADTMLQAVEDGVEALTVSPAVPTRSAS